MPLWHLSARNKLRKPQTASPTQQAVVWRLAWARAFRCRSSRDYSMAVRLPACCPATHVPKMSI
jgi:hypothetical protein